MTLTRAQPHFFLLFFFPLPIFNIMYIHNNTCTCVVPLNRWHPVSGHYSPKGTYPFLQYTFTELIPSAVLFIVVAPSQSSKVVKSKDTSSTDHRAANRRLQTTNNTNPEQMEEEKAAATSSGGTIVPMDVKLAEKV
jgi:hypothetical protein